MDNALGQKTFVVTGATSGIGLAVAQLLAKDGGSIIGVGHATGRCREAEEQLGRVAAGGARIAILSADLALQTEVRRAAHEIGRLLGSWGCTSLDVLINNAGTVPFWQVLTPEGFDQQWAVNHLAAFLLTHELLPLLRAAPAGRVVTVTSGSHYGARLNWTDLQSRRRYNPLSVYKQTKLANVLFTAEFNRRWGESSNVRAIAADPGLVNTDIGRKSNSFLARFAWELRRRGGVPPEDAARGIYFVAVEPAVHDSQQIYWRNGRPKAPEPYALNPQAAKQLWLVSSEMCGVQD